MRLSYPVPTSTAVSRVMRANRKADTGPELRLRSALYRRGLRYRVLLPLILDGLRVRPDLVFPRAKVAVFVDGCFWHGCPAHGTVPRSNSRYWLPKLERNAARDVQVTVGLAAAGWSVVRVWEHEDPDAAAERVSLALRGVRHRSTRAAG